MTLADLVTLALATWRITSLLVYEEGPYFMFTYLRHWVGVRYALEDGHFYKKGQPFVSPAIKGRGWAEVAKLFICPWCMSIWVGIIWLSLYFLPFSIGLWLAIPFALSAIAVVTDKLVRS